MTQGKPVPNIDAAVVINLVEMTQHQPESIVSRTLLQDETGTLTPSASTRGRPCPGTLPFYAIISVLDGQAANWWPTAPAGSS